MATVGRTMLMSLNPGAGGVMLGCCKGPKTDGSVSKAPIRAIDAIAVTGVILSILTLVLPGGAVRYDDDDNLGGTCVSCTFAALTAVLLLLFSPYTAFQKRKLMKLGELRSHLNQMRDHVNEFMYQNNKLSGNVTRLHNAVDELEQVEKDLSKLANTDNVEHLVKVVSETKRINKEMKKTMEASIIQQILTTVIRTDRDLDMKIGPWELKRLMVRLNGRAGFIFNKDKFLELLDNPTTEPVPIAKIMKVIRNLKDDSLSEEQNVFVIQPEQLK